MLYYLIHWLNLNTSLRGTGLIEFISFRTMLALLGSLFISVGMGKRIIRFLQKQQVGEEIRNLGLQGQMEKKGTPTMGGLIIVAAILIPTLLFAKVDNVYIWLCLISTVWLCLIGFIDDYIKVFKKNKKGLAGKFKLLGQVGLGLLVGTTLYFHPDVTIRERMSLTDANYMMAKDKNMVIVDTISSKNAVVIAEHKSLKTSIPFIKNHELDYGQILARISNGLADYGWILYIFVCIFIIAAVSNGANITDGLDGLATGVSAIIVSVLAIFAYVSGNAFFAKYLNIMFIPNMGELVIFTGAMAGALVGFLWWNTYPAQVFMGDTGSLTLGGLIAIIALMVRKELLIPVMCGIFLIENLSVMIQVSYFKYTKRKYGEGRRVFKMSPLHHHYQKVGYHESKIVGRFWVIGVGLALLTIITLKVR
ncbi:MAG: phospho-N-acetylmuramoyl-pentapeptide-transferase [Bacteroidota bacterium]|nr:phospho-N-acetylmuramoyl-pentapeptide-transferase [Bacteroidota bacterium]